MLCIPACPAITGCWHVCVCMAPVCTLLPAQCPPAATSCCAAVTSCTSNSAAHSDSYSMSPQHYLGACGRQHPCTSSLVHHEQRLGLSWGWLEVVRIVTAVPMCAGWKTHADKFGWLCRGALWGGLARGGPTVAGRTFIEPLSLHCGATHGAHLKCVCTMCVCSTCVCVRVKAGAMGNRARQAVWMPPNPPSKPCAAKLFGG